MRICLRCPPGLTGFQWSIYPGTRRLSNTRPKDRAMYLRRKHRFFEAEREPKEESESDVEPFSEERYKEYAALERELNREEPELYIPEQEVVETPLENAPAPSKLPDYLIRHSFVGFDPRRMDLERFPRLATDFDGRRANLIWMGTECQRCGLQIRRERRTNRETSLNVYAHPKIPDELLRHCPEEKLYPVLWRTRDPYVALDILYVEDY